MPVALPWRVRSLHPFNRASRAILIAVVGFSYPICAAETPSPNPERAPQTHRVDVESAILPHHRVRAQGSVQASVEDEELARWNLGGTGDPSYISNTPRFHPGPRVVLDVSVLGAWGRTAPTPALRTQVERVARSKAYWPIRICYESALRTDQSSPADVRLRVTAVSSGSIRDTAIQAPFDNPALSSCLKSVLAELKLGPLAARRLDAEVRIRLWPGDAPVPLFDEPLADEPKPGMAHRLATANAAWIAVSPQLSACADSAMAADSSLWGRVQLWVDFDEMGTPSAAHEHESRFPIAKVTECVLTVARSLSIGPGPTVSLLLALRLSKPPAVSGDSVPP